MQTNVDLVHLERCSRIRLLSLSVPSIQSILKLPKFLWNTGPTSVWNENYENNYNHEIAIAIQKPSWLCADYRHDRFTEYRSFKQVQHIVSEIGSTLSVAISFHRGRRALAPTSTPGVLQDSRHFIFRHLCSKKNTALSVSYTSILYVHSYTLSTVAAPSAVSSADTALTGRCFYHSYTFLYAIFKNSSTKVRGSIGSKCVPIYMHRISSKRHGKT